jgi:hypothetical protein
MTARIPPVQTLVIATLCVLIAAAAVLGAGCGSGSGGTSSESAADEAASAAQGDIPDNARFLRFVNDSAAYSILYPEGWARSGSGNDVTFTDKSNSVEISVGSGPAPSVDSVASELDKQAARDASLQPGTPQQTTITGAPAIKVTYTKQGPADPVTGQHPTLMVDRYLLADHGRVATVDLATPQGVDNVDAYRMMIESFRWS